MFKFQGESNSLSGNLLSRDLAMIKSMKAQQNAADKASAVDFRSHAGEELYSLETAGGQFARIHNDRNPDLELNLPVTPSRARIGNSSRTVWDTQGLAQAGQIVDEKSRIGNPTNPLGAQKLGPLFSTLRPEASLPAQTRCLYPTPLAASPRPIHKTDFFSQFVVRDEIETEMVYDQEAHRELIKDQRVVRKVLTPEQVEKNLTMKEECLRIDHYFREDTSEDRRKRCGFGGVGQFDQNFNEDDLVLNQTDHHLAGRLVNGR